MADSFTIKRGDTAPSLAATLTDDAGVAINLTGASVVFEMKLFDQVDNDTLPYKIQAAAVIVSASDGTVRYDWAGGDTDTVAKYRGEFVITHSDASVQSVPTPGFIIVNVVGSV